MEIDYIDRLKPVSLKDISEARLLNRVDTKYLTTVATLRHLFDLVKNDYAVLEIGGLRSLPYYTCYFDTLDFEMFHDHQRGKKCRQKVRIRRYEGGAELSFLEIKDKNNKGRTVKTRIEMDEDTDPLAYRDFVSRNSKYRMEDLVKNIENHFYRTTLVRKDMSERITIDTNIEFHNILKGTEEGLPNLTIIEWKRKAISEQSPMKSILRELHARETGFSKYVVGMALTDPSLRQNRLKPRVRLIRKVAGVFRF